MNPTKSILVIDDEQDIHTLMQQLLGEAKHRVFMARDATQGPMMARRHKPDLIILDINMPGGGGKVVYDRLRMMSNFASTPILIYSAIGRDAVQKQITRDPYTLVLDKPARAAHILATVECMLDPN
jgi:DNA-binding response OmpR family regulator